ncbi:MAG: tetratricopeptide repeat protein [Treponema sp.]|nr:tetratricopeptide repeat protein [Treponema sp.]
MQNNDTSSGTSRGAQSNQNDKLTDKINDFVQRNRKGILTAVIILAVGIAGTIAFFSLNDYFNRKAIADLEELDKRLSELKTEINEESGTGDAEALLADLNAFAKNKSGFAGGKAWSSIAQIHTDRKEWAEAESAWRNAARAGAKTYLGPVALFNAAVAAEEQGKLEEAIELLRNCIAHKFDFPAAPRAQFSIGRINESLNNIPAAIEAYRAVMINWSHITVWSNLAQSRITALEIR